MGRIKTFVNGGNVLPSDLDEIQDDYEVAFGHYKHLREATTRFDAAASGTYVLATSLFGAGTHPANADGGIAAMYLDPNRYFGVAATSSTNPRTVNYSLGVSGLTNNTAVGAVTFTVGLYPVSGTTGTGAAQAGITLGTVVSGSTISIASPGAGLLLASTYSGDFAAPAAGHYAFAVVVSAGTAANSSIVLRATLSMRQL